MTWRQTVRLRGRWLTMGMLVALLVLGSVLAAVQKLQGVPSWMAMAFAGAAAAILGFVPLWLRWRDQQGMRAATVRRGLRGTEGPSFDRLPRTGAVDLATLRVHPAIVDLPYVRRSYKEEEVAGHLREGRPVLVVGSSMVGKTRLAAKVVQQHFPDWPIVIPDSAAALVDIDKADLVLRRHVIWLDDLDRFLSGGGVAAGLIRRLATNNVMIATLRAHEWGRLQPTDELRPPEWDILAVFELVTLDRDRDRPEVGDLDDAVPDEEVRARIGRVGIGEYVGAARQIRDRLTIGAQASPLGYGLVLGAVDWHRTGLTRPVPAELLPALALAHLTPRQQNALHDLDSFQRALRWATEEINPTVSLLEPRVDFYVVYDYALDQLIADERPIPEATWNLVLDRATDDELVAIGYQAEVTYGLREQAERSWRRAAEHDNTDAMFNLGVLLSRLDRLAEAEPWLRRAAERNHMHAMHSLGALLHERGESTEARTWWRQAAEREHAGAMYELAVLLHECGEAAEAETWWRRAADRENTRAMFNLALVLDRRGEATEAEMWYRRAAERENAQAMVNLAVLLDQRGQSAEAESWWRRAADFDDTEAMVNLGVLVYERGDAAESETWYRRAADRKNTQAMVNLAVLLEERGETAEAETWYRRAVNGDHTSAIYNLGLLLHERGDLAEAEIWYRRAAEREHPEAMCNLGGLLRKRGESAEAESWWRRAADRENTLAMVGLAAVLHGCGDLAEAETWYRRAADRDHIGAMSKLGVLLDERGASAEAEAWWRRAAERGDAEGMYHLGLLLDEGGDLVEAEIWYRRAAEHDNLLAMIELAGLLKERGGLAEAETWYRQADIALAQHLDPT